MCGGIQDLRDIFSLVLIVGPRLIDSDLGLKYILSVCFNLRFLGRSLEVEFFLCRPRRRSPSRHFGRFLIPLIFSSNTYPFRIWIQHLPSSLCRWHFGHWKFIDTNKQHHQIAMRPVFTERYGKPTLLLGDQGDENKIGASYNAEEIYMRFSFQIQHSGFQTCYYIITYINKNYASLGWPSFKSDSISSAGWRITELSHGSIFPM